MSTPSSTAPAPTSTGNSGGNSSPTSSPLLFFVALGFGVVFTNLWIIVGVKYCFRYNQRNRQARQFQEGGDIDMGNLPRPHRRRREKKLMTMEEVNERFPLTKYKTWRATREQEGLPAAGGIAGSRAASLKDAEGVLSKKSVEEARPETTLAQAQQDRAASAAATAPNETAKETPATSDNAQPTKEYYGETSPDGKSDGLQKTNTAASTIADPKQQDHRATAEDEDDDDDDPIRTAAPPEMLAAPGDTCAICLDTLEDDDDVRGLTCGHAFHAACVDPWLTGRRACCPLCKADYYVPKPRPEGEAGQEETTGRRSAGIGGLRINMPGVPPPTRYGFGRSRIYMLSTSQHDPNQQGQGHYQPRQRVHGDSWLDRIAGYNRRSATQSAAPPTDPTGTTPQTAQTNGRWPTWVSRFHRPGPRQPSQADGTTTTQPTITPSALEAGRT